MFRKLLSFLWRAPKPPTQESVIASAIIKNGQLWAAPLHSWMILEASRYNRRSFITANEQGFLVISSPLSFRFVDRLEAYQIARAAGQIPSTYPNIPQKLTTQMLGWKPERAT